MKDKVLTNFGKKKESSGQSLKLQNVFQKMQAEPVEKQVDVVEDVIPKPGRKSKIKEKSFNFSFEKFLKRYMFAIRTCSNSSIKSFKLLPLTSAFAA